MGYFLIVYDAAEKRLDKPLEEYGLFEPYGIRDVLSSNLYRYPENTRTNRQLQGFVDLLITKYAQNGDQYTRVIITESDILLNHFRAAVKQGRIATTSIDLVVFDFEYHPTRYCCKFGPDGEITPWPPALDAYEDSLMQLL